MSTNITITPPKKFSFDIQEKVISFKIINTSPGLTVNTSKIVFKIPSTKIFFTVVKKPIKLTISPMGERGLQGVQGVAGLSTYLIAVNNGFIGTETEWLASLQTNILSRNNIILASTNGGYF